MRLNNWNLTFSINFSPVDVPLIEDKPLASLDAEHMDILVQASQGKHLVVVPHWLCSEELFWLFKRALHFLNLVVLSREDKAIRDPTVIASKNHDF